MPAACLAAVDEIIREEGVAAVSLRETARRAGVTHSAPAHHFGDKAGLLTAFAAEGFRLLRDHMVRGIAASGQGCGPEYIGLEYVRFAISRPAHFAVMFRPEHLHADDEDYRTSALEAFAVLLDAIRQMPDDPPPDDQHLLRAGIAAWSMAHGFANLWLDGNLSALSADSTIDDAALNAFQAFGAFLQRLDDR